MADPTLEPGALDTDHVHVRTLREGDLDAIVRIDRSITGRARHDYFKDKLAAAMRDSRLQVSLVAELDGAIAGFLLAQLYYGEFGRPEPSAVIDTIAAHPELRGRRVGDALMRQFLMNARALGVERVRTEVAWNDTALVHFFDKSGFRMTGRIVLERSLDDDG